MKKLLLIPLLLIALFAKSQVIIVRDDAQLLEAIIPGGNTIASCIKKYGADESPVYKWYTGTPASGATTDSLIANKYLIQPSGNIGYWKTTTRLTNVSNVIGLSAAVSSQMTAMGVSKTRIDSVIAVLNTERSRAMAAEATKLTTNGISGTSSKPTFTGGQATALDTLVKTDINRALGYVPAKQTQVTGISGRITTDSSRLVSGLSGLSSRSTADSIRLVNEIARATAAEGTKQPIGTYYTSSTAIPYSQLTGTPVIPTNTNQLTNGSGFITGNQTITLSGDVTGSGATAITTTLKNTGTSGVQLPKVTTDAQGRVISSAALVAGDIPTLPYIPNTQKLIYNTISKTANYTVLSTDFVATNISKLTVYCDATGGSFTITLPTASSFTGYSIDVIKTDTSANTVTVANATGTYNVIGTQYQTKSFITNATIWANN